MAVFVRDSMTGPVGVYSNLDIGHTAEAGGPWVRNGASPDTRWYIFNNRVHCGVVGAVYASGTPANADYTVECDYIILTDVQGPGIAVRMSTSALNFYGVRYQSGQYILGKYTGGAGVPIGTWTPSPAHKDTHKLRLSVSGSSTTTLTVAVDGATVITATDSSSPFTAAGKAGMFSIIALNDVGTAKHIDNFVASDGAAASAARSRAIWFLG